ncbi:MAG: MarR family transcriptional regulator, partial [Coriobacteriales bacterium]
ITEYRVLLKAHELGDQACIGDLVSALNLPQNLTSKAAAKLEDLGYIKRKRDKSDKRVIKVHVTKFGEENLKSTNDRVEENMDTIFGLLPRNMSKNFKSIVVTIGKEVEGANGNGSNGSNHVSSAFVTAVSQSMNIMKQLCREIAGASITECRILQILHESGDAIRMGDIAKTLLLKADTVTRAANNIELRKWATRVMEDGRPGAVYLKITPTGEKEMKLVQGALDAYIQWFSLSRLNPEQILEGFRCAETIAKTLSEKTA